MRPAQSLPPAATLDEVRAVVHTAVIDRLVETGALSYCSEDDRKFFTRDLLLGRTVAIMRCTCGHCGVPFQVGPISNS